MRWETVRNGGKSLEAICRFKENETSALVTIYTVNPKGEVKTFEFKINPESGITDCQEKILKPRCSFFADYP